MFQFRPFPAYAYLIQRTLTRYCRAGFPHSDIHGSRLMCSSPWLFAACHVLRRLLMPRHSPCALISLTYKENSLFFWFSNYAGISNRFVFEIVIVTLQFLKVPQLLKFSLFASLLPCFSSSLCSVFKVQLSLLAIACTLKIKHCKPG